jgi:beta-glucosidase
VTTVRTPITTFRVATTLNNRLASIDPDVEARGLVQRYGLIGPVLVRPYRDIQVFAAGKAHDDHQADLGNRSARLLAVDGLVFKDLNGNGKLDVYEDWRQSPEQRAEDLVRRLRLPELAGLLLHGNIPSTDPVGPNTTGEYDFQAMATLIDANHVNSFVSRFNAEPRVIAAAHNRLQAMAEDTRLGIPLTISSDPRNHIQYSALTSVQAGAFSKWPEPTGFAAIGDPDLVRRFADIVRQEYLAVGIREALSPQADLATDPRWTRLNGTFGEDAETAKLMIEAYVEGIQHGAAGLDAGSIAAIVKHWVGYGAQENGLDSHNAYGRFAVFPAHNFDYHIIPFTGAFAARVAGVMPSYSIFSGVTVNGKVLEPVGAGFNHQLLTELLRGRYGFEGVIVSDWSITRDCGPNCANGAPSGATPTFADLGMPWGVEGLTKPQRFAKAINAGVDQIGGSDETAVLLDAVGHRLVTHRRLEQSAYRVLLQKFQLGLFDNPYVDASKADSIVGNPGFVAAGEDAQSRSLVLLENRDHLLPYTKRGGKVYLVGVDASVAEAAGMTPVTSAKMADLAVIRSSTPSEVLHPRYALGRFQHEGRLDFREGDAAYDELLAAAKIVPTVFVVDMNRPAILANVQGKAAAIVASFGVSDQALFAMLTGKIPPRAHLPFELPSSMAAVLAQKEDLPHDSASPLYPYGYGLTYSDQTQ